ncbi:oxysterol-binding protein-related protein 1 isoform X2 [Cimex lectularius]|uniref:Oxysterol-binding protein n=1 Tax=Cimex lectularius TaxID=79782 RepID=A0A8I6RUQ7_CIMLE|nr:oxysterol-binding protein-related protein 1 isoform X2 [Cimex lectularius]
MVENLNELELCEMLLHTSRNGDFEKVQQLLTSKLNGKIALDINCKGRSKSNLGWTPLHLASYFGHKDVVELLLDHGTDINAVNDAGDTALHKASFIGREDLVLLLLERNADVNIRNGEGKTAKEVGVEEGETRKLLAAAERTDLIRKEEALLSAARNGDLQEIRELLKSERPPYINCVDSLGNTSLHCASYRGQKEAAVLLLQNGIDSTIKNLIGQTAFDLARDAQMSQVLCVRPVRLLQMTVTRFEGQLLKRSRFLGWKPTWTVLERGVLTYFNSRADASSGVKRRDFKYLDGGLAVASDLAPSAFCIDFSDGTSHKLSVLLSADDPTGELTRQKWLAALSDHIAFNSHYMNQGRMLDDSDDEDDIKPLGSMQDSLNTASASYQILESRLQDISNFFEANPVTSEERLVIQSMKKFEELTETASSMLSSLDHCLNLIKQQEEIRVLQLKREQEKCRVLEEALNVLAKEHHELEQSMVSHLSQSPPLSRKNSSASICKRNPRFYDTSDDEFYDAFEAGGSESETLVTAGGSDSDTLVCIPSPTSSIATLASCYSFRSAAEFYENGEEVHRQCLPVPMFCRNDFSIWSVLKNSLGKELSKITMPVVFNEPLSFLQRMVEYMEYAHLLRIASEQSDPVDRMQYICAFAVSALASNWDRLGKPFNPLLGETYELERKEYRVICEQVSHHPPISAFHADSEHFIFHGSIHPKLKFWGKSVEIQPKGIVTVELPKWGEAYTWSNVNCCVHNIVVGKLWIEQYGTMEIVNTSTGHKGVLSFKPAGWFSKDLHRVEGFITDKHKKKLNFLYGKWTDFIRCTDISSYEDYLKENAHKFRSSESKGPQSNSDSPAHTPKKVLAKLNSLKVGPFKSQNSIVESDEGPPEEAAEGGDIPKCDSTYSIDIPNSSTLWEATPRPANCSEFYQFTLFAMSLNELEPGMEKKLCPTDCRLRPDIRKLENGDLDGAAAEKTRLEEKQRKARKAKKGNEWKPRWFCQGTNPYTGQEDWLYTGGYWDRNFAPDPHIF